MNLVLLTHTFVCVFMTGLCWFVQVVHYPLFHQIKLSEFAQYEKKNFRTGYITIPLMVVEMCTGLWLLYQQINSEYLLNILLFGMIGLSTMLFQVPIHLKLTEKPSVELINKLIKTNWIRTVGWTIRSIILAWVMVKS